MLFLPVTKQPPHANPTPDEDGAQWISCGILGSLFRGPTRRMLCRLWRWLPTKASAPHIFFRQENGRRGCKFLVPPVFCFCIFFLLGIILFAEGARAEQSPLYFSYKHELLTGSFCNFPFICEKVGCSILKKQYKLFPCTMTGRPVFVMNQAWGSCHVCI